MVTRVITLAAPKNLDGVLWPAGVVMMTDDAWAEALVTRAGGVEAAPTPTYVRGEGWRLGSKKLSAESHVSRTIVIGSPLNIHGVRWPAGTYVCKDDGHAELLLLAGATEPSAPIPVRVPGRGWVLS